MGIIRQQPTCGLAKLGGEVIIRISVYPLTGGVSPNCVQLPPQLRQAAGTLTASRRTEQADNDEKWNELEIENKYDTYRIF